MQRLFSSIAFFVIILLSSCIHARIEIGSNRSYGRPYYKSRTYYTPYSNRCNNLQVIPRHHNVHQGGHHGHH